jgi:predicted permease
MSFLSFYYRYRAIVRSLTRRDAIDREMREEMELHLAQVAERYVARGMSPRDARDAARREFGNVALHQEHGRDARTGRWIETTIADVRFALRQIVRRPLASATIVGVLAIGIGVHAALFTFHRAMTQRPPVGVSDRDDRVRLRGKQHAAEGGRWYPRDFSYPEYMDLAARRDLFAATTAWATHTVNLDFGDPDRETSVEAQFITGKYFEIAGSRIALGTALPLPARADGTEGELVAVIGDAIWRELYGGVPDVIGKTLKINDALVRIVGVAAPRFGGLTWPGSARTVWMPLASRGAVMHSSRQALVDRDSSLLRGVALLAPGVDVERASRAVEVLSAQAVAQMTPAPDRRVRAADVAEFRYTTGLPVDPEMPMVWGMLATVAMLVLFVACTNVSALVIGAGVARSQEIAIRLSLGASRRRIIRQLLTESCVLAVAGGAAGLAFYWSITRYVAYKAPEMNFEPDFATAMFTLALALGTGILFGLSPALHATRTSVNEVLKGGASAGGASTRTRLQSTFVVAQIAITQPLLVGIAIFLGLILRENGPRKTEESAQRVVSIELNIDKPSNATVDRLRVAMRNIQGLPGVQAVVQEPDGRQNLQFLVLPESRAGLLVEAAQRVRIETTEPGYFSILGVPILRGRDVAPSDTVQGDMPVIIGSDYAHELWGNADPLGRRFRQMDGDKTLDKAAVVVGVYDATRATTRGAGRRAYTMTKAAWHWSYLARTSGPAHDLIRPIRDELRKSLPEAPISSIATLEDLNNAQQRIAMQVGAGVSAAGALVLLLASIGLYGVIGLAVTQRRREIGIRIALGAKPVEVVAMLFKQGLRLGLLGLVIGLPVTIAAAMALAKVSAETGDGGELVVSPFVTGPAIAVVVLIVTAVATWLPARRAAVVDPTLALRSV